MVKSAWTGWGDPQIIHYLKDKVSIYQFLEYTNNYP